MSILSRLVNISVLKSISNGAYNLLMYVWRTFGKVSSYEIISLNLIGLGVVLTLLNANPEYPRNVLFVVSEDANVRLYISFGIVSLGWLIIAYKKLWMLVIGCLAVASYGITSLVGVANGSFSQLALTVFVQNIPFALAILRGSYAEVELHRQKEEVTSILATVKTVNGFPIIVKQGDKFGLDKSDKAS